MTTQDIHAVLAQRPCGLVFDIDGTLSQLAATPDEARLFPGVAALLERARQHAHVAIVTGRGLADGARMVGIEGLTYIGTHGLEWSDGLPAQHPIQLIPEALPYVEPGKSLLDFAARELADLPGLLIESKSVGGTLHYRLAPDPEQARQRILAVMAEPARQANMRLGEGKRAVEIRAPLTINKGEALRRLVERDKLRSVLFAGDDRTDLDAVLEIEQQRKQGLAALSIVVQYSDTLPELLAHADIIVQKVEGMVELLYKIVEGLEGEYV